MNTEIPIAITAIPSLVRHDGLPDFGVWSGRLAGVEDGVTPIGRSRILS